MTLTVKGTFQRDKLFQDFKASDFVLRDTKPWHTSGIDVYGQTCMKVGAGVLRAAPTVVINVGDAVPGGTWSGDRLTITQPLVDRIANCRVKYGANDLYIENCRIRGDGTTTFSGTTYMVDSGGGFTGNVTRWSTIENRTISTQVNAFGQRNHTVEYCDVSKVIDGFVPAPSGGVMDVQYVIRGNYVHDLVFVAPDAGHGNTPLTAPGYGSSTGRTVTGPWGPPTYPSGIGWTHCDGIQVEIDGTTGVNIYGNTIDARWSTDPAVSTMPLPVDQNGDIMYKELSCLMLNAGVDLIIQDNWFDGGEYCINNGSTSTTGLVQRNRFGRKMANLNYQVGGAPNGPDSGYYALMTASAAPNLQTFDGTADKNIWEDTGVGVIQR